MGATEKNRLQGAVNEFAAAMKEKLLFKKRHNWTGWWRAYNRADFEKQLKAHAVLKELKGENLVDIANYAMFLYYQEQREAENQRLREFRRKRREAKRQKEITDGRG